MLKNFLLVFCSLLLIQPAFAKEEVQTKTLYVFSKKAVLYEKPSVTANQVLKLKRGQILTIKKQEGVWYLASINKKTGWVSRFLVTSRKPAQNKVILEEMKKSLKKDARRRASAYSTAAATRGLSDEEGVTGSIKSDMKSIFELEKKKISDKELKRFIREGRLGEKK